MKIPMASPEIDESDVQAVLEVVRSGRLALGPKMVEFEQAVAEYVGVPYAIAVSSGTAGLHLVVRALGLGEGDEVLVPSFTFAASVNVLLMERVRPVFVEVEPETFCIDIDDLQRKITPRTKGIMVVDTFGHPAEWNALNEIAERHNLVLIDDCCEALGAEYQGRKIGQFGDAGVFAFYPNKQITTGEGGMIVTRNEKLAKQCRSMRNQGRAEMGAWLEHQILGYNYRLDEMSCALGVSQMKRLEQCLQKREQVAQTYTRYLQQYDWVRPPVVKPYVRMSWFVYVVLLAEGLDRDRVIAGLEAQGIPARGYFAPIHLQPYIREMFGTREGDLPKTEAIAKRTLALPFHNNLSEEAIRVVAKNLERVVHTL